MIAPARWAAYQALRAVESGADDLPHALARGRTSLPNERDRALAGEIAIGTLRWRAKLDHLVAHYTQRRPGQLDPEVLDILRLSTHQLLHLERIPPAAAINDAVDLARRARKRSAAPLVNAVLRSIDRERDRLPLPPPPPAPGSAQPGGADDDEPWFERALDYLSITWSHPRWLARRWLDRFGWDATRAWVEFNNRPAPLTLRANRLVATADEIARRLESHGIQTQPARYAPDGLIVTRGNPVTSPLAGTGLFVVQDEASQLVSLMARAAPGERILDACASPGGKTTALAADMLNQGLLVAADVRPRRMELLRQTVAACRATCARLATVDLLQPLPFRGRFDCVLIDAPCSGLGTIRRDPEIRWRRSESDLPKLAESQRTMVERAAEVVEAGGRLVYATCSSEPEENDEVVDAFLEDRRDFEPVDPRARGAVPPGLAAVLDSKGRLRTAPHAHGLEAFFAVVVRRKPRA